ncbi:MAG: hypothetical protein E7591_02550 [Ruminococcaceae bacterium]|nr:hypothetical protein [Oscillospiraceae bacterium]
MKGIKRVVSSVLVIIMLISCLSASSFVSHAEKSGKCGENVSWTLSGGTLTISGTGAMEDYGWSGSESQPWYSSRSSISRIVIENGITHIGSYMAYSHKYLKTVYIPESVTSIGESAFWTHEVIGTLHITDLSAWCNIDFQDTSANPMFLGASLYLNSEKMVDIVIPDDVEKISSYAFKGCDMNTVTIGKNVKSIGDRVFYSCDNLTAINVSEENPYYSSIDGVLFDTDRKALIKYPVMKTDTEYTIPDFVREIDPYAFFENSCIQKLTMPDSVTTVGEWSFRDMEQLKEAELSDNIETLPFHFMSFCYKLEKIKLPANIKVFGDYSVAFNAIKEIEIPYGTEYIGYYALSGMDIKSLSIPDTVTFMDYGAFSGCTYLKDIDLGSGISVISGECFSECGAIESIDIPDNIVEIESYAFYACTSLRNIKMPEHLYKIGSGAFSDTSYYNSHINWTQDALYINNVLLDYNGTEERFVLPSHIKGIAGSAFSGNESIITVEIPDTVQAVGEWAFSGCTSLKNVNIPEGVERIGAYCFYECEALTKFEMPDSVKIVESYAFLSSGIYKDKTNWEDGALYMNGHIIAVDKGLTGTYVVKDGTKSVAGHAFAGCEKLSHIILPESVKNILYQAFVFCGNLKTVYIPGELDFMAKNVFGDDPTVICYANSYVHKLALEEGWPFKLICKEHIFTNYVDDNNTTCTQNGTKTAYCDNGCGASDTIEIENTAFGHSFTNYVTISELGCTVNGVKEAVCDNGCGTKDVLTEEAQGHKTGEWEITKDPDYYNLGCKIQKCTVCTEVINTESIPVLDYDGFPDVWENSWYAEGVEYCYKHGYITGTDKGIFNPNGKLTREQFVVILARVAGADLEEYKESPFTDVSVDIWYGASVIWANSEGIINGIGNGRFGKGQPMTREALATMLYRYAKTQGINTDKRAALSYCEDAEDISEWAHEACAWAVNAGLLGSTSETVNILSPKVTVTRAQAAKIFMYFDKYKEG